jgi:hypothetical protein
MAKLGTFHQISTKTRISAYQVKDPEQSLLMPGGGQLWDKSDCDLDWDQCALCSLLEAVCTLTGLDVPEEAVEDDTR